MPGRKGQNRQQRLAEQGRNNFYNQKKSHMQDMISDFSGKAIYLSTHQGFNESKALRKWMYAHADQRTDSILEGQTYEKIYNAKYKDINEFYSHYELIGGSWEYRITDQFYQSVNNRNQNLIEVLTCMDMILSGNFTPTHPVMPTRILQVEKLQPGQAYFLSVINSVHYIFETGIDKIPIIKKNRRDVDELIGFKYEHVITFIDLRTESKIGQVAEKIAQNYHLTRMAKFNRLDHEGFGQVAAGCMTLRNTHSVRNQVYYLFDVFRNAVQQAVDIRFNYGMMPDATRWQPLQIQPTYLNQKEQESMTKDEKTNRWISKDEKAAFELRQRQLQQAIINKEILARYADFSSAAKLVQLLQRIPNFKIKLTDQEQQVIGADGNVLVIGRSGTGKTTCAILRLFSMEMLFQLRLNLYKQKQVLQSHDDLDNNVGLHCIFATASPVLTGEIKRYYAKLTTQIKEELEKKKQKERLRQQELKRQEQQQEEIANLEQSQVQVLDKKQEEEQYMAEQMQGIELKEENELDDDIDNIEDEEEKAKIEMDQFDRFQQMNDKDFPAFFTIRKLILMIDGSLNKPYFSRTSENKVIGSNLQANWHQENDGVMMINGATKFINNENNEEDDIDEDYESSSESDVDYSDEDVLEQEYQRQLYLTNKQTKTEKTKRSRLAQEVDFTVFRDKFWPTICHRGHNEVQGISASLLWTQIYSHIKGSAAAHTYSGQYVPKRQYASQSRSLMIPQAKLEDIFELFVKYEQWKLREGYYDMMDVVNYVIHMIKNHGINMPPIHYLMIDEVQDLPHAMLYLLCAVTEQGLFFSGDTAQNIAKGVGFRFQDLKSIFSQNADFQRFDTVSTYQLTVNFRSHNNILQLANSLVSLLEIFFPRTIDRLAKERSDLQGPKPVILNSPQQLFYILSGNESTEQQVIEFGCNQVIIVKDQESKKKVPLVLQHALILTIYEAKGLEFEDVILYNFFDELETQWSLLNQLELRDEFIDKDKFNQSITRHSSKLPTEQELDENSNIYDYEEVDGKYKVKKLAMRTNIYGYDMFNYSSLCNEIKQLYVAVTRPKKRLLIYDEKPENRKFIQELWQSLNLIDVYAQEQIQDKIASKTSPAEWKKQGNRMFKQKFYEQAIKCYQYSGDANLEEKSKAYALATEGAQLQSQLLSYESDKKDSRPAMKEQRAIRQQKNEKFRNAGDVFKNLGLLKQAAQCYYSGDSFLEALKIYEEGNHLKEAGESAYQCGKYSLAGEYFAKADDMLRAIDAYEKCEDYDSIFKVLQQFKNTIDASVRQVYLKRYLPIVLNKLSVELGNVDDIKKEQTQKQEIIQEHDDEDSEEDESQEENSRKPSEDQQQISEPEQSLTAEQISQLGPVALVKQVDSMQSNNASESFQVEDHEKSQSFQIEAQSQQSESFQVNFEHLSHYDPDDQWLQNENKSIIESLASKKSDYSDYSAISYGNVQNNPNLQLVKTKGNIFIQDSVMQGIIKYISWFSEDFKNQLLVQRSKSAQLSQTNEQDLDYMVDFILDLDLIDISFVYLVLDILEQFKSFKLCIFVCNRYKLTAQLGRYLVSIAANYSPLAVKPANINPNHIANGTERQAQIQNGIVASFAVHNVFENINPEYLRLKFDDEEITGFNSLGLECYKQLILLGFWKKAVYQMNIANGLKVCETFLDFKNWKVLYFTRKVHQLETVQDPEIKQLVHPQLLVAQKKLSNCFTDNFEMLSHDNSSDGALLLNILEQFYNELQSDLTKRDRIPASIFYRHNTQDNIKINSDKDYHIPEIFSLTKRTVNLIIEQNQSQKEITELLEELCQGVLDENTLKKQEFETKKFEATYCLFLLVLWQNHISLPLKSIRIFVDLSRKLFFKLISALQKISLLENKAIRRCLYFIFKTRELNDDFFNAWQDQALVHRTSVLITGLLQRRTQVKGQLDDYYFSDIDLEFITAPNSHIEILIVQRVKKEISNLIQNRFYLLNIEESQNPVQLTNNDYIANLASKVAANGFTIKAQKAVKQPTNDVLENYARIEQEEWLKKQAQRRRAQVGYLEEQDEEDLAKKMLINQNRVRIQHCSKKELFTYILANQYDILLEPLVFDKLIELGLQYKAKIRDDAQKNHKYIMKMILIFNFIGYNHYSVSYLQRKYHQYLKFVEYLVCRKHYCLEDAYECYFEFHGLMQNLLYPDEIHTILTSILLHQLIGSQKDLIIPHSLLYYLNDVESFKEGYQPLESVNQIEETLQWIKRAIQRYPDFFIKQYMTLIFTLIINTKTFTANIINTLQDLKILIGNVALSEAIDTCSKSLQERRNILVANLKISSLILDDQELINVSIENLLKSDKEFQDAYQRCLDDWENIFIKDRATVKKIEIFYSTHKNKKRSQENNVKWQISDIKRSIRRLLVSTLYSMYLDNPFDFHFIAKQISLLERKREGSDEEVLEDLRSTHNSLLQWQKNSVKFELNVNKLLERNRKMLAIKWMNQKAGIKLQKIQKKKRGMKRQELLELKKLYIK